METRRHQTIAPHLVGVQWPKRSLAEHSGDKKGQKKRQSKGLLPLYSNGEGEQEGREEQLASNQQDG